MLHGESLPVETIEFSSNLCTQKFCRNLLREWSAIRKPGALLRAPRGEKMISGSDHGPVVGLFFSFVCTSNRRGRTGHPAFEVLHCPDQKQILGATAAGYCRSSAPAERQEAAPTTAERSGPPAARACWASSESTPLASAPIYVPWRYPPLRRYRRYHNVPR